MEAVTVLALVNQNASKWLACLTNFLFIFCLSTYLPTYLTIYFLPQSYTHHCLHTHTHYVFFFPHMQLIEQKASFTGMFVHSWAGPIKLFDCVFGVKALYLIIAQTKAPSYADQDIGFVNNFLPKLREVESWPTGRCC